MPSPTRAPSASPAQPNGPARTINSSNRFGLDYHAEAARMGPPPVPIVDVHTHINGRHAARLYRRAADMYGVETIYSMTQLEQVAAMREVFGPQRIRFIAVPNWAGEDKRFEMGMGFMQRIEKFHALGCRIVKFWAAPRSAELAAKMGEPQAMRLDAPQRVQAMRLASELGMIFMTHVGDPDTWFATKYADANVYGTKPDQYRPLEDLLDRFTQPWIAAHMGGWPEDLEFLDGLLARHSNLHLDTSAAKWMIRELSRHSREDLVGFLSRWKGRVLFGSDIVTTDEHLAPSSEKMEMAAKANDPSQAFDLYASRYWALRMLWETDYAGESPIADPDLQMVEPATHGEMSAPPLLGRRLPRDLLQCLYHDAAAALLEPLHAPLAHSAR